MGTSSLVAEHPSLASARDSSVSPARARLLDAIARVSAQRGYAAATVADIVRAAGVSRSTFYEEFTSKEALFLESYRHGVDVLVARVAAAVAGAPDWQAQLRAGVRAYLAALEDEPQFARAYLLEVHSAGRAALDARAEALTRFAERYEQTFAAARREHPGHRRPPKEALLVLCAGTEQLLAERLREREEPSFSGLEDVFCDCAQSLLHGPAPSPRKRK
ncbi:MAG: TetR/AcrR family transcriptional regulator [Solirubrobacterales bacterium]|nr:TetR/AcrR family transcriptional regulator [Solirubrobacterales bacterium]